MSARRLSWAVVGAAAALGAAGCTVDEHVATLKKLETVRAGQPLPDEATCEALVRRTSREPRPMNATANQHVPTATELAQLGPWSDAQGYDPKAMTLQDRITGNFTGTTDEILQWVACKWGFDEDLVRAEAAESTSWNQGVISDWTGTTADCPPGAATRTMNGTNECAQTYGMYQVLWKYHKTAWPMYRDSTAFHADYVFALRRVCFEGLDVGQGSRVATGKTYTRDDEWGCLGAHFSGIWYDEGANSYISRVQGALAARRWTKPEFCNGFVGCVLPR